MESEASNASTKGDYMGIEKLISIAAVLAMIAASTGTLPRIVHAIRAAQLKIIKESQASKWGQAIK
jgi:hypothetical protein